MISAKDRQIIKDLALRVAEISAHPLQDIKRKEWIRHNKMQHLAPRVLIFPFDCWKEIIPADILEVSHPYLREIEFELRKKIYHWEHFRDDTVIEPFINIPCVMDEHQDWGLGIKHQYSTKIDGAYGFLPTLTDEEDLHKMMSITHEYTFDDDETLRRIAMVKDIVGDALQVDAYVPFYTASLVFELIHLRGFSQMLLDFYDNPDFFHKVMGYMCDSMLHVFKTMEKEKRLTLNNRDQYLPSGSLGYSDELPQDGFDGHVRLKDLWGFADTQEFTDVSPPMWQEFAFNYQLKLLKEFGLISYGCCENLDKKLDHVLTIPNIRKISISPWTDIRLAAQKIERKAIFCRKPNPAKVIFGFHKDNLKKEIEELLQVAGRCNLEIVLKDIQTCNGHPEHLKEWVDITQACCK